MEASDLAAFRCFCDLVARRSSRKFRVVGSHDWSSYPRIQQLLTELPRGATGDVFALRARTLLDLAVEELASLYPERPGDVSVS